jgi:alkylhydroperoxidase family enzyme
MTTFNIRTLENAPEQSRGILKTIHEKMGFIPNVFGVIAESPALLRGLWELRGAAETGLMTPVERAIVRLTASRLNGADYCMAASLTLGEKENLPADVLEALRLDQPLKDPKLEALHLFTKSVMKRLGRPDVADIESFRKAGYTDAHVMEVVLGISQSLITNYVNHIAQTPLDKAFEKHKVTDVRREDGRQSNVA